jgi:hypothetical protein
MTWLLMLVLDVCWYLVVVVWTDYDLVVDAGTTPVLVLMELYLFISIFFVVTAFVSLNLDL